MVDIVVNESDNLPLIQKQFYLASDEIDLTGYDVSFIIMSTTDGSTLATRDAELMTGDPEMNGVQYQWTTADNALFDEYAYAVFRANNGTDTITVPNNRPLTILKTKPNQWEFSYSGDPANSDRDAVRFVLSDTADPWKFTDSEIDYTLETQGNVYSAAAELARIRGASYTDKKDKTVGPLSVRYGEIGQRWNALARDLTNRGNAMSGAIAIYTNVKRAPYFVLGGHDTVGLSTMRDRSLGIYGLELSLTSSEYTV